jgi:hypothetical protein
MENNTGDLAADRIRGIPALAKFIGESERRTSYLVERRYVPVGREGRQIVASKRVLREHYARLTGAPSVTETTNTTDSAAR